MGRQKPILGDGAWRQRQLGDAVRNNIQIGGCLRVTGKKLEETRVVDAVIVVMPCVHVQCRLGHRSCTDVEHVGQAFTRCRIQ